jgi:acid phosphatase family membrane protein YuiD
MEKLIFNRIFYVSIIAWLIAQTIKLILDFTKNKKLNFRVFVGTGGMPSAHTAIVSALSTAVGLKNGFGSTEFAITAVISLIIMTDAAGVRRSVGRQASALNKIISEMNKQGYVETETVKELLGHTPVEVFIGAIVGILTTLIFY